MASADGTVVVVVWRRIFLFWNRHNDHVDESENDSQDDGEA